MTTGEGAGAMKHGVLLAAFALASILGCLSKSPLDSVGSELTEAERTQRIFGATCAHCHVGTGVGAPRMGHPEDWNARETRDFEQLLQHTIDGDRNMPPLGTCGFCTEDDLRRLIALMVAGSDIAVPVEAVPVEAAPVEEDAGR